MPFHVHHQEHAKIVLALPSNVSRLGVPEFLPLTIDQPQGAQPLLPGVSFQYAEQVIATACRTRAVGLIDEWLTVAGRRECTPERYLRDWRAAIAHAIPIADCPARLDLHPFAVFNYDVRAELLAKAHRTDAPEGGLRALLDRHPGYPDVAASALDPNRRLVWVDLTTPDGPFDAMWLRIYLGPSRDCPFALHSSVELPGALAVAQKRWHPSIKSLSAELLDPYPQACPLQPAAA